jgi:microsomal dipeptidase-like Zn-dependent dipeptidase
MVGEMRAARRLAGIAGVALLAVLASAPAADAASAQTRYSLVHNCYTLNPAAGGGPVGKQGGGYLLGAPAESFRMQATDLGRYLLYGLDADFLAVDGDAIAPAAAPSDNSDWTVREAGGGAFTIVNTFVDRGLGITSDGKLVAVATADADQFEFVDSTGCPQYPEVDVNATGKPTTGSPGYGEVTGLLDGHMHGMAFEFLGGRAHCGKPWDRFGAPYALRDCPDHEVGNGCAAVLENVLYGNPARCHDPVGWPSFADWPDPKSLTHEQSYWKWLERAWRGGERLYVNLFVENRILCEVYPYKQNDCNEMKSVLLQAQDIRDMQDYIDAQFGGPGKGFFRIVTNPYQARKVINQGKMAVVQGMEVSEPFDCGLDNGFPTCDADQIDSWLDRLHDLGVRQLEITNKFDNALTGVAGDNGTTGTITNAGNFLATGKFLDMRQCQNPEYHDHSPTGVNYPHNDDMILGNGLAALLPGGTLPVYPDGPTCNSLGLSPLGEHAIRGIMQRHMIFDPDHMSVIGRDQALSVVESKDYSGIVSSHSWSTDDALPRIYALGGVVTPYAGSSTSFVHQWSHLRDFYRQGGSQYFGVGWGADMNGFGAQGLPRGADVPNPVSYPFKSFDGSTTLDREQSGQRVYDINVDGVAHYGLYPDWVEDLRMLAGDRIIHDLGRGPEAYLQMWERADGIQGVRCDKWRQRFLTSGGFAHRLELGDRAHRVLERAGQPVTRTRTWRYCANGRRKALPMQKKSGNRQVAAVFDRSGRVALIGSTLHKHRAGGVRPGTLVSDLPNGAQRVSAGLFTAAAGGGRSYFYGVRGDRVRFVGVASKKLDRAATLRAYVRRARLD